MRSCSAGPARSAARRPAGLLGVGWQVDLTGRAEVDWLVSAVEPRPGPDDEYFAPFLDYATENRRLGLS